MRPSNLTQLTDDLMQFRSPDEDPAARGALVRAALPRCLAVLDLIPESHRNGQILELGASPYLLTLSLRHVCDRQVTLASYHGGKETRGRTCLTHQGTGEQLPLDFDLFNIEEDKFPYPDASFDVVIFSELIEHLALNPVCGLSEMHRILRPGGHLIVSTPNSLSFERLDNWLHGGSPMVDKYVPSHGYGARHNREYHPQELRELLEGTGFEIEQLVVRDLVARPWGTKVRRRIAQFFLGFLSKEPRGEHIFLAARRRPNFRWHFPGRLFDHMHLYHLVRFPFVEMGINDAIQCIEGWGPLEEATQSEPALRRVTGCGKVFLKTPDGVARAGIEMQCAGDTSGTHPRLIVRDRFVGNSPEFGGPYLDQPLPIEPGRWQKLEFSLPRLPRPADDVEVLIEASPGTAVHRVWLEADLP